MSIELFVRQHRMLYVFDPTAMHNIIVKDQYIYEEAAFFIKWVLRALPDCGSG